MARTGQRWPTHDNTNVVRYTCPGSRSHAARAQRKDELDRRFVRAVADEIASISHAYPNIERFILAGNQRLAHALRTAMHPTIAEQVIAVTPMPYETPDDEVLAAMAPLAEAYEREYELAQIEDVISRAQAGRRGALGLPAVQEALDQHAVRRLFLPFPENQELVEELLVKAVASSSDIEFVHGDAAERLQAAGGVGAHLYYQL
jgi:peptide subunit release factor 1 (eRF1)